MKTTLLAFFFGLVFYTSAQTSIEITTPQLSNEKVVLIYFVGNKQFVADSFLTDAKGALTISKKNNYNTGLYLLYFPLKGKKFHEFILDDDQQFSWKIGEVGNPSTCSFKGSAENEHFLAYLKQAEAFKTSYKNFDKRAAAYRKNNQTDSLQWIQSQVAVLKNNFNTQKIDYVKAHPNSYSGQYISYLIRPIVPETIEKETQLSYYKSHFFDFADFKFQFAHTNSAYLQMVEEYLLNLTPQTPDSLIAAADLLIAKTNLQPDLYRLTLSHILEIIGKSSAICTDAVYVHLVDTYYKSNKAPWMNDNEENKKQLARLIAEADRIRPSMCGATAFNLQLKNNKGEIRPIFENDTAFDYTFLIFWDPECEHCEVLMKKLAEQPKWIKDKKIRLVAVAAIEGWENKSIPNPVENMEYYWATTVEETGIVFRNYFLGSTPEIFILDKQHRIKYKDLKEYDFEKAINNL